MFLIRKEISVVDIPMPSNMSDSVGFGVTSSDDFKIVNTKKFPMLSSSAIQSIRVVRILASMSALGSFMFADGLFIGSGIEPIRRRRWLTQGQFHRIKKIFKMNKINPVNPENPANPVKPTLGLANAFGVDK